MVDVDDHGGRRDRRRWSEAAGGRAALRAAPTSLAPPTASGWSPSAETEFGKLDVLFNNAGIMHADDDDAVSTDEAVWDLTMNVNAKGVFLGCKYGIPALRRAGGGSIINTASFVALLGRRDAADRLHREQGRGAGADARAGGHPRAREHPRERALPGAARAPSC